MSMLTPEDSALLAKMKRDADQNFPPAPVAVVAAKRIAPVIQPLVDVHVIEGTVDAFLSELRKALIQHFQGTD